MPSIEEALIAHPNYQKDLVELARSSIEYGLEHGTALPVSGANIPELFDQPAATFVTLHHLGELRGCIGTLSAHQSLARDVVEHAFAAAFRDSRFHPVRQEEIHQLDVEISILTPSEDIYFDSEEDLLNQLQPGEDGVTLEYAGHRGTFLPQVWEQLPEPRQFLEQLKRKAGLPSSWWDPAARFSRYQCIKVRAVPDTLS